MTHPCHGCTYFKSLSTSIGKYAKDGNKACDYINITGHARQLICKCGKDCTVKKTARPSER